jgi:hypothetical protein
VPSASQARNVNSSGFVFCRLDEELVVMDIHKKVEEILELQKRQLTLLERSISRTDQPNL